MRSRVDCGIGQKADQLPCNDVDLGQAVYLVVEKLNPQSSLGLVGGNDLHGVSPHTEAVARQRQVIAVVAVEDQLSDQLLPAHDHARAQRDNQIAVLLRIAQRINAGHGRNNDDVPALKQCRGGGMAQAVDLIVDQRVLLNVHIFAGNVGLRLVVVVVGNKILHRRIRKKGTEFGA